MILVPPTSPILSRKRIIVHPDTVGDVVAYRIVGDMAFSRCSQDFEWPTIYHPDIIGDDVCTLSPINR